MQTCSRCNAQSADSAVICPNCGADLRELSATAMSLRRMRQSSRVLTIRLVVPDNACPACQAVEGTYPKETVPTLPVKGCSCPHGCTCFYEPMLSEIYP
ncbi:double zinc ribbon [Longilinea arvoryzae]|uniref:Double zinc ribbon n=1 Tax=Longilinea arvoryzae TaxID=360412 RepID=A0A0S7BA03_9CHLR|nr:zinc ribbon domain-containing protein [Longilinea arvoryzae]GAP14206.1 double zinc ribbon [Longilinea arvoryzae]